MALSLRHSRRLLSPGEALLAALLPPCSRRSPQAPLQRRTLRKARELPKDFSLDEILAREASPAAAVKSRLSAYTLNGDIPSRWVQVRAPDTNKLGSPELLTALLASIDSSTQSVMMLGSHPEQADTAVVRVVDTSSLLEEASQKAKTNKEKAKAAKQGKPKQIEMNWAIGQHDLEMKLKQLEKFLAEGRTVEVLMAHKKRQRRATMEEAQETLNTLKKKVEEVGGRERSALQGHVGAQASLVVEKLQVAQTNEEA